MTQPSPLTPKVEDKTSYLVERSAPDIQGFCHNYPLRRHKFEDKANEGSYQCRADWAEYIGPIGRWGNCNPWEGHFGAVVLPLCRPERLPVISYILECTYPHFSNLYDGVRADGIDAFLYDNVVESVTQSTVRIH